MPGRVEPVRPGGLETDLDLLRAVDRALGRVVLRSLDARRRVRSQVHNIHRVLHDMLGWLASCTQFCIVLFMSLLEHTAHTLSVTEAAAKGVPGLVREVEDGDDVIVARRGRPVAAVIGMERVAALRALESDTRDLALVLARMATDTGNRASLDNAITAFGFSRAELEAENAADADASE